jgi:hypothetical protein
VISLEGPTEDELVEQVLSGRMHGRATDLVYHLTNDPPPKGSERLDPGPFERREDDTEGGCSGGAAGPTAGSTRRSKSATRSGDC